MSKLKLYGVAALAGLLLFGGGAAVGRYSLPARVETHEIHTSLEKDLQVVNNYQQVDINQLVKQLQNVMEKKNLSTEKTKTTLPNGTVTETEKTLDLSVTDTKTLAETETNTVVKTETHLLDEHLSLDTTVKDTVKTYAPKSNYHLSIGAGYNFARLFGKDPGFNLAMGRFSGVVGQLQLERRIVGPFWGCIWVQTTGVAGLCAQVDW